MSGRKRHDAALRQRMREAIGYYRRQGLSGVAARRAAKAAFAKEIARVRKAGRQ
jgi:hypothetical protein